MTARPARSDKAGRGHGAAGHEGLTRFASALGHRFADPDLLAEALTHRSAAGGRFPLGYERLEFLGDRVLGLVIAEALLARHPEDPEGAIARRFTGLVRREALAEVAAKIDLPRHLRLSDNEERGGGRNNPAIQADACEAVIGALYLDGGLSAARRFIARCWEPLMAGPGRGRRDPKTRLQEWLQGRGMALPKYRVIKKTGPAHEPLFTIEVGIEGGATASARARSKREAEQEAAAELLARLGADADP